MVTASEEAYASCGRDARHHYENFPVASLLLPRRTRRHVAAVYAFARAADDFADEGEWTAEQRKELLDGWAQRLAQAVSGHGAGAPPKAGEPSNAGDIFVALGETIQDCSLPVGLFEDLLSAFRQDVDVARYDTWADLLDYCRRSANPVGRIVLRISGKTETQLDAWSDDICTALQLTNFWQDLTTDYARGRVYLPLEERQLHGAREEDLAEGRITPAWQKAISAAAVRTRTLFEAGKPLCEALRGRLRYELRATWLGGTRVLDRLGDVHFDVAGQRPTLGALDVPWIAWRMLAWPGQYQPLADGRRSPGRRSPGGGGR
ncbi:MAG: squalene synthase HpnC [Acidobacteria bacterium]|nr:squalene synthase HpnC [Acidobacteriota bacterium]